MYKHDLIVLGKLGLTNVNKLSSQISQNSQQLSAYMEFFVKKKSLLNANPVSAKSVVPD